VNVKIKLVIKQNLAQNEDCQTQKIIFQLLISKIIKKNMSLVLLFFLMEKYIPDAETIERLKKQHEEVYEKCFS